MCNGGEEPQIFCQPRNDGHDRWTEKFHKLICYLPPSECTGNTIIYSIIHMYLVFCGGSAVKNLPAMQMT